MRCKHGVVLVAAPIGPGHAHQLERIGRDLARVLDMGTPAEILERILLVGADDRLLCHLIAILVDLARFQPVDQFQLVGLIGEEGAGFVGADLAIVERMLAADDLAHALLDRGQILR